MNPQRPPEPLPLVSRRHALGLLVAGSLCACTGADSVPAKLPDVPFSTRSRFRRVYANAVLREQFLAFLSNVFHLVPEHALHRTIAEAAAELDDDHAIYARIQDGLPRITPSLASLRFALPALAKQKREIAEETARLVAGRSAVERYMEIGTPGRYVRALREHMHIGEQVVLVNVSEPGMGAEDIAERGQLTRVGDYVPLADYTPLDSPLIPKGKLDLVTNYIGLHHARRERLEPFVVSIRDSLRQGGVFVLRDHDVIDSDRDVLVSLAHDVFNAGLGFPWPYNDDELRYFQSVDAISDYLEARGFKRFGPRIAQPGDPTHNLLVAFERV